MERTIADPDLVRSIRMLLPAITREHLQATLGVSETTWVKVRDGKPLKRSTLARIEARIERLGQQA